MKHRDVDYGVEEADSGYGAGSSKTENGRKVVGEANFRSREVAVAACIQEINNSIERVRLSANRS